MSYYNQGPPVGAPPPQYGVHSGLSRVLSFRLSMRGKVDFGRSIDLSSALM